MVASGDKEHERLEHHAPEHLWLDGLLQTGQHANQIEVVGEDGVVREAWVKEIAVLCLQSDFGIMKSYRTR